MLTLFRSWLRSWVRWANTLSLAYSWRGVLAVPVYTYHMAQHRIAYSEVRKQFMKKANAKVDLTESEELDRLLASHYRKGQVRSARLDDARLTTTRSCTALSPRTATSRASLRICAWWWTYFCRLSCILPR